MVKPAVPAGPARNPGTVRPPFALRKKREDTAEGCRTLARDDMDRAAAIGNDHMRSCLERSASAWASRAALLERLEASFHARAEAQLAGSSARKARGSNASKPNPSKHGHD